LDITRNSLPLVGQKVVIFVGRNMWPFREPPQFESAHHQFKNFWSGSKKMGSIFHMLHRN